MRFRLIALIVSALLVVTVTPGEAAQQRAETERFFPETGFTVRGHFLQYWEANGGLALNGYPLIAERRERLEDGNEYTVQYFERVRLELHPENMPPNDVLLGQFGRYLYPPDPPTSPSPSHVYFPETGHNLSSIFRRYWEANGGLRQFGYPLSELRSEELEDGRTYLVQYFERARFEYHSAKRLPNDVILGQFGRLILEEVDAGPVVLPVVGERAVGEGFAVTLHRVLDPSPPKPYLKPDMGMRWVAVELTVENTGSKDQFYSRYDAALATMDGKAYDPWLGSQEPQLGVGTLQPGQAERGWINFEIHANAEVAALLFEPNMTPPDWVVFGLSKDVTGLPKPRSAAARSTGPRQGCGSRGGPGYRLPNGECAGWDDVYRRPSSGGSSGGCGSRGGPGGPRTRSGRCPSWR